MNLSNARIMQGASEWYDEHIEDYEAAKSQALVEFFEDAADGMTVEDMDTDWYQGLLDLFSFQDEVDWLAKEYESYIGGLEDQMYQEYKERDI